MPCPGCLPGPPESLTAMTAVSEPAAIGFPGRYVQGPGALAHLGSLARDLGAARVGVVADAVVRQAVGPAVDAALSVTGRGLQWLAFDGECTAAAIDALAAQARAGGCQAVVGLGGGKAIDTAKGVSAGVGGPLLIAPTIASNDSPTSRVIVVYDEAHRLAEVRSLVRNPDAVVVDTDVICRAPARFFAAGMGDALSKRFEAAQCAGAGGRNFFGTPPLALALALGERCHATIRAHGPAALARVAAGLGPDDAVERVVEATVLLSGLAFESGGLSLAHALNRGFTAHPVLTKVLHGEMVAFGTVVQLIAQEESPQTVEDHARFTLSLGLPVHLGMMGADALAPEELQTIAELTCRAPYIGHLRPAATVERVRDALVRADALGRRLCSEQAGAPAR